MSDGADVRSLDQLVGLRERVAYTRAQTLQEAEALQVELQKLTRWIEEEALVYWQNEFVLSERLLNESRDALLRCEAAVRADEKRPCTDERKRVERAKARRGLCEPKLRAAREARLAWQKHVTLLRGRLQKIVDMADSDLQNTATQLADIIGTLQTYAQIRSNPPTE